MDFDDDTLRAIAQVYKEEGNAEYKKKEFRNAIVFYTEGINVNCKDDLLNAIIYTNRATSHFSLGSFHEALEDAKRARKFQPFYLKAIFRGAKACKELGLYEEAIKWCDDGLRTHKDNEDFLELKRKCVHEQVNLSKGGQQNVDDKWNLPLVALETKDEVKHAFSWRHEDKARANVDKNEEAIEFLNQRLAHAKENGNLKGEAALCYLLGAAYHKLGQLEKAIEYYRLLLAVGKNLEDREVEYWAAFDLAEIYQDNGDLMKAIENYRACLDICKDKQDTIGKRAVCDRLVDAYCKLGEYKVGLDYIRRSLAICKELGDRLEEGRNNGRLGLMYRVLNDLEKAKEHFVVCMTISQEVGALCEEGIAIWRLADICFSTHAGDFNKAEEYLQKCLHELKDEAAEQRVWGKLGNVYLKKGNFRHAITCFNRCLTFSKYAGKKKMERAIYCNLGNAYLGLGNVKTAIEYFEKNLVNSKEAGNMVEVGNAYGNLGNGYSSLGNYKLAIQHHGKHLTVCKELGDRSGEGIALTNLGISYSKFGNFKKAIELHQESLKISQELKDKVVEGSALTNLGNAYQCLCDYKTAAEYYNGSLRICQEIGDRVNEGNVYGSLGCMLVSLGRFKEAIQCYNNQLVICKEVEDRAGEGRAYGNLGVVYNRLGKYALAVDYHNQHFSIFKELGNRDQEGMAYRDLGHINENLGDLQQAKEYYDKYMAISKETGNRASEGDAYLRLSYLLLFIGDDVKQAMEYSKQHLNICKETGNICGEGSAYLCQGHCFQLLGFPSDAIVLYHKSVQQFNHVRSLLHTKDEWKISLRNEHRMAYLELWNALLELDRIDEAFAVAEKARAQALVDLLVTQYGFDVHQQSQVSQEETASELITCAPSNTVFLAICENDINVWLLQNGENIQLREQSIDASVFNLNADEDLDSFVKKTYKEIGVRSNVRCEDRSLDALYNNDDLTVQELDVSVPSIRKHVRKMRVDCKMESSTPPSVQNSCLSYLYDVIVAPVIHHFRGNELVIVPDGPLYLVPFAALKDAESRYLCESFSIRVIPSLTCLRMIMDAPPDHHCKSDALIVGDPWVQEVVIPGKPKLKQLQFARKEAEMIGSIVKTSPLIGSDATKKEVLKRLNSVALIHLAAHGCIETGEIALAPNTSRKSQIPRDEDFLLTISDVLSVGLRARLVVLSCCYSGRGEIKDEGVVGIARAFLGAGARSILVSLWAIGDEATMEFMRVFYQHLVEGKKASEALNCSTNYMRESKDFGKICQWAPFVLIGDDVTLECLEEK